MKVVVLCVFLVAATTAFPKVQDEFQVKRLQVKPIVDVLPDGFIASRITNGREAVPHSIPYQAYLLVYLPDGSGFICGGSLISPRHVLTAAHCLVNGTDATVYLGAHNVRQQESSRISVRSTTLIPHKNYNESQKSDDIGLIVLNEDVELNEYVNVVPLPSRKSESYEGDNALVSGWGLLDGEGADISPALQEVNITVISNKQCKQVYDIVIDSQICTQGTAGEGACQGDSGGPLVVGNTQVGIVSYGAGGCPPGYPSAYTRITSYLDWLEENTGLKF